ncbi:SIMPL domain-containing protein [Metabacillus iocasae]|uniref:Uncharacterized protein YggE n=1 Tax=Priestia iocasae TaxID=2291674 RepID=A0ABS2QV00_9BACI|nr:SIMPL domain-containing protein [Metabacillus iocasae]MBM7703301.1 uncharacterized protein YggE [Metabacillus iocasae]
MQPPFHPNYSTSYNYPSRTQNQTITVTGNGSIEVDPDTISLVIGVRTEHKNVQEALRNNATISTQMITALNNIGISDQQIETKSFFVNPQYDYSDGKSKLVGYEVQHLFTITVNDVKQAGQVYEVAISNGANIAQDIQFSVENPEQYYNQALTEALLNAQEKANVIAETIKVTINPFPSEVVEETPFSTQGIESYQKMAVFGASSAPPIQSQQLTISAIAKVIYHY